MSQPAPSRGRVEWIDLLRRIATAPPPGWEVALALAAPVVLSVVSLRGHALTYLLGGPVIAGLTAGLLVARQSWHVVSTAPLRAPVALGTISYGCSLRNYPLTLWLRSGDLPAVSQPSAAAGSEP